MGFVVVVLAFFTIAGLLLGGLVYLVAGTILKLSGGTVGEDFSGKCLKWTFVGLAAALALSLFYGIAMTGIPGESEGVGFPEATFLLVRFLLLAALAVGAGFLFVRWGKWLKK